MRLQTGNWNQLKKKRKGGFTTIEVLVVVVLTLILASGAIFGISRWVSWTAFNQQNEAARTLFVAAQNQLTVSGENGRLAQIEKRMESAAKNQASTSVIFDGETGTGTLLSVKDLDGKAYTSDTIWQNAAGGKYKSEIYSIVGTSATYEQYLAYKNGTATSIDDGILLLYQMLEPYVYDTSLLHANICLEFDPADGQVFSLLYSDDKDNTGFTYDDTEGGRGIVSIANRQSDYRWARMTGYYGVSTLSTTGNNDELKPSLTDVRLENGDLLEMTFGIEETAKIRPQELVGKLNYKFVVYDDKKNPQLQFDLDLAGQSSTWLRGTKQLVPAEVVRYDESGQQESLGSYNFLVWIDTDNHVHVVLDAADIGATTKLYQAVYLDKTPSLTESEDLKKTLSFHRFGLNVDNIYYTVQATGEQCKPSSVKTSNTEHAYFGSVQRLTKINTGLDQTEKTTEYTIQNARHLYNIRYEEDYQAENAEPLSKENTVIYRLEKDINWIEFCQSDTDGKKDDGLYWFGADTNSARFSMLSNRDAKRANPTVFPSIRQLRPYATLTGQKSDGKIYKINGLEITAEINEEAQLYQTEEEKTAQSAGLFLHNYGTISSLKLDRIQVTGDKNVGAFCGVDSGTLRNLTVSNSDRAKQDTDAVKSVITGKENVGGIVGTWEPAEGVTEMTYEKLVNRAEVRESDEEKADDENRQNFGGIIGFLEAKDGQTILVQNCKNYGPLTAVQKDTENLGGIVGYAKADTETNSSITLKNCTSSLQYPNLTIDDKTVENLLNGNNVGGIIGQSKNVSIENCSTKKEENTEGYLFGNEYVGGIVGRYITEVENGTISGGENNSRSVNELHVLGNRYVGGIVGENQSGVVSNWENRGFVAATGKFAGGIVGANGVLLEDSSTQGEAVIQNCTSKVPDNDITNPLENLKLFHADYVGGIAGYNNGTISCETSISLTVNVSGGNFVGGVVGYNDANSKIYNYSIGGGSVVGEGSYVGGFVGANTSRFLFSNAKKDPQVIQSNPNTVIGDSCVGGTIGGNFVFLGTGTDASVALQLSSDNFLGTVQAEKAIAGGFIGYNQAVNGASDPKEIRELLLQSAKTLKDKELRTFADVETLITVPSYENEGAMFVLGGTESTTVKFAGVESQIYVGGVIGYNESNTTLKVQNVINQSPVTATESIPNEKEKSGETYAGKEFTYSYAGGILGKVGKNVTIDGCYNQDAGDVVTQGTYLGGICEVNEGTIQNGKVSNIGKNDHDYVGGIAGLNKGTIQNSTFDGKTVTGKNYVGGIAAENEGSITGTTMTNAAVKAEGTAGGMVGENNGRVSVSGTASVTVTATGEKVGGIIGVNKGTLSKTGTSNMVVSGSVSGKETVGGIVGENQAGNLTGFENRAEIKASNGNAGGIVGINNATITSCVNYGTIEATKGNAGGIVAKNNSTISNSKNYAAVDAKNDICGGIAAINAKGATISKCTVEGENNPVTFTGRTLVGGVVGQNYGTVNQTNIYNSTITNDADSKGSALGGIAAENHGTIAGDIVGNENKPIQIVSNAADVTMGGLVGENDAIIQGASGTATGNVYADLKFASNAGYGNMGGIAGKNGGEIIQYTFSGTVKGTANNPKNAPTYDPNSDVEESGAVLYGYGGIVGVNGFTKSGTSYTGTIENCIVDTASITGQGDANNIVNVGGIAGINNLGSVIQGSNLKTFGTENKTYSLQKANGNEILEKNQTKASVYVGAEGFGHVGGIAGLNSGEISHFYTDKITGSSVTWDSKADNATVFVESSRGHVGGIVGYNRRTGVVKDVATGKNWIVFAAENAQDNGCGGIVGYQASEYGLQNCFNRARVVKTVDGSNGVGGMIGRMEVASSNSYVLDSCKNYGNIYGYQRVGGMVGVWKYYGGTVSNCINYGEITSKKQGAAGIVGCFYQVTDLVTIVDCQNHAQIDGSGEASAGIVGDARSASLLFSLQNCVNTGNIANGRYSAGICAVPKDKISDGSSILNCRNYGFSLSETTMGGIVRTDVDTSNLTMKNCYGLATLLDVSGTKQTNVSIGKSKNIKNQENNYFLGGTGTSATPTRISASGTLAKYDKSIGKLVTGTGTSSSPVSLPGLADIYSKLKELSEDNKSTYLTKQGDLKNNARYDMFDENDDFLTPDGETSKPSSWGIPSPSLSQEAAGITVSWAPVGYSVGTAYKNAPYYRVQAVYSVEGGNSVTITKTVFVEDKKSSENITTNIPLYTSYNGKNVTSVTVSVQGGVKYKTTDDEKVKEDLSEKGTATMEIQDNILPTPKYHLELENNLEYRLYLDNQQDYIRFLQKQGITDEGALNAALQNLTLSVTIGDKEVFEMNLTSTVSETVYNGSKDDCILRAVVSDSNKRYLSSVAQLRQSNIWKQGVYTGTGKIASVQLSEDDNNDVGFYGDTMDTLNYQLHIEKDEKSAYYMRSELTAIDTELKVPVAVATSQLQVSSTSATAISTQLAGLPENLLDETAYSNLSLRSYPVCMANHVVYTGHDVHGENNQTSWKKDELTKLYVTKENHVTTTNTGTQLISGEKLASGFVIEYNGEDSYSLYYNTLLDYNEKKKVSYETNDSGTQMKNQVYFYDIDNSKLQKQPTPTVEQTYDESTEVYRLTWDNTDGKASYSNADYTYRILGSNETTEGTVTAQIAAGQQTSANGKENVHEESGSTWEYTEISAFVSRRGTMDTNGKTKLFPTGAAAQPNPQSLKRRLSQMTKPTVSLHKDASGKMQKDALRYDVKYKKLSDTEQAHVGAYEITVERSERDTKASTTYSGAAYQTALDQLKQLYSGKNGVSITEKDGEIVYKWKESATLTKTMQLQFDQSTKTITKNLTSVWLFNDPSETKQTIDLNDYDRGEQLEVSVRAIPHETESNNKACPYRKGPKGIVAELTLPDRLEVPVVTNLTSNPSYKKDSYMTLEEFENGLQLKYTSGSTYDIGGTYQVAIALYNKKGNAQDTDKVSSGEWNAGAEKTLIAKNADTGMMSGDLQNGNLTLYLTDETGALLDDCAGKWLKIAMRSVSDNQVSSLWSDEDEASEGTVNYAWIQIPRVQLATPEISDTTQSVTYPVTGGNTTATVKQTVLKMELPSHSELHRIQIVRSKDQKTLKQNNKEYAVQYLDWIYLEPTETTGEYAVFYATTDPNTVVSSTETDAKKKNSKQEAPVGQKIGVLTAGKALDLPYQVTMQYPGNDTWTIPVKSRIALSKTADGTEQVTLLLPDAEQVDIQSPNQEDLHTAQVSLQSIASEKQQSCYADSKINNWWRNDKQTELTELDGYSRLTDSTEKVNATWEDPTDEDYKDYKLLSGSLKNYRLVYELTSQTGTTAENAKTYYISAYGYENEKNDTMDSYALVPTDYLQGTVTIRVAAILPQSNLSSWEDGTVKPLNRQEETQQNLDKIKDFLTQLQQKEQERQQAFANVPAA